MFNRGKRGSFVMDMLDNLNVVLTRRGNGLVRRWALPVVAVLLIGAVVGLLATQTSQEFPNSLSYSVERQIDRATDWMVAHWRPTTISFRDGVLDVMLPIEKSLLWVPWWLFIGAVSLLAWRISGLNVALISVGGLLFIGITDVWDEAMSTLAVVGTATFISVTIAIPVGIVMAKYDLVESMIRPILDLMQNHAQLCLPHPRHFVSKRGYGSSYARQPWCTLHHRLCGSPILEYASCRWS